MCRNIKVLANFAPPATDEEVRASALQFVRKVSGMNRPSREKEDAFNRAVEEVTETARRLITSVVTTAEPRNREDEARKARERARQRPAGGRMHCTGYRLCPFAYESEPTSGLSAVVA